MNSLYSFVIIACLCINLAAVFVFLKVIRKKKALHYKILLFLMVAFSLQLFKSFEYIYEWTSYATPIKIVDALVTVLVPLFIYLYVKAATAYKFKLKPIHYFQGFSIILAYFLLVYEYNSLRLNSFAQILEDIKIPIAFPLILNWIYVAYAAKAIRSFTKSTKRKHYKTYLYGRRFLLLKKWLFIFLGVRIFALLTYMSISVIDTSQFQDVFLRLLALASRLAIVLSILYHPLVNSFFFDPRTMHSSKKNKSKRKITKLLDTFTDWFKVHFH